MRFEPYINALFNDTERRSVLVSCALMFLGAILAIVLSVSYTPVLSYILFVHSSNENGQQLSYRQDNLRRNELYGIPEPDAKVDTHELADKVLF